MINNNKDVARNAAEIFHRLTVVGDIDINLAKTALGALVVINKSYQVDLEKKRLGIDFLPSEGPSIEGKGMIRKV